jgi:phosphoglucosamine mutase
MGIFAKFLLETKALGKSNEVVGTLMSNFGLELYLKELGITFSRTKVGDRYIVEQMRKSGAVFGGEPSGHLIFKEFATTGDGILAALKVVECLKYFNKSLSELASEIKLVPQILNNVVVKDKKPFTSNSAIMSSVKVAEDLLGGNGRVLLRYSGTENLARVMVEGSDGGLVKKCADDITNVVKKELA